MDVELSADEASAMLELASLLAQAAAVCARLGLRLRLEPAAPLPVAPAGAAPR